MGFRDFFLFGDFKNPESELGLEISFCFCVKRCVNEIAVVFDFALTF